MHSAALRHPTYGVNAQLQDLPKYDSDPDPALIAKVLDVTEDADPAIGIRPLDYPVLVVSLQSAVTDEREFGSVLRDALAVQVFIDIVTSVTDPGPSARDVLYYIRAILRCLRTLMLEANQQDTLSNGIMLVAMNRVTWGPLNRELKPGRIVGTVVPEYLIRDQLP